MIIIFYLSILTILLGAALTQNYDDWVTAVGWALLVISSIIFLALGMFIVSTLNADDIYPERRQQAEKP